jgi:hypothetical protein
VDKRFLTLSSSLFLLTSISRSPQGKFKVNDFFSLKDKITKNKSAEEQKIHHTKRNTHHSRILATPILEDLSCKEAKREDENKEFSPRKKIICREYNITEKDTINYCTENVLTTTLKLIASTSLGSHVCRCF